MRWCWRILTVLGVAILLVGCGVPPSEQVMKPIAYHHSIPFHSNKTAYLYWKQGQQYADVVRPNGGGSLLGVLVSDYMFSKNPARYTFTYGKAQQAVFMTSLQRVLENRGVFKEVVLSTAPHKLASNEVTVVLQFKQTKVGDAHKVKLDAGLKVLSANKKTFSRSYLVQSNLPSGFFRSPTFIQQQTNVSKQLMKKVMISLGDWYQNNHRSTS